MIKHNSDNFSDFHRPSLTFRFNRWLERNTVFIIGGAGLAVFFGLHFLNGLFTDLF